MQRPQPLHFSTAITGLPEAILTSRIFFGEAGLGLCALKLKARRFFTSQLLSLNFLRLYRTDKKETIKKEQFSAFLLNFL
jgi:hypothetical protein